MKRLISIIILLFLVGNSFAKTADFLGVRVVAAAKGGLSTRFITTAEGVTTDLQPTLSRIASGGKFPHIGMTVLFLKTLKGYYRNKVQDIIRNLFILL